eukprot:2170379-Pyramimonas_sp.AAC.1
MQDAGCAIDGTGSSISRFPKNDNARLAEDVSAGSYTGPIGSDRTVYHRQTDQIGRCTIDRPIGSDGAHLGLGGGGKLDTSPLRLPPSAEALAVVGVPCRPAGAAECPHRRKHK